MKWRGNARICMCCVQPRKSALASAQGEKKCAAWYDMIVAQSNSIVRAFSYKRISKEYQSEDFVPCSSYLLLMLDCYLSDY